MTTIRYFKDEGRAEFQDGNVTCVLQSGTVETYGTTRDSKGGVHLRRVLPSAKRSLTMEPDRFDAAAAHQVAEPHIRAAQRGNQPADTLDPRRTVDGRADSHGG